MGATYALIGRAGLLRAWGGRMRHGLAVFTSNVDGQFQKAGFDEEAILEVHGSIHHLQCTAPCSEEIWPCEEDVPVDVATMRALSVPSCPSCGRVARPNILMFGDWSWLSDRTRGQEMRFDSFCAQHQHEPLAVVEMGAGTAIPTIRYTSEQLGRAPAATVIRINPREPQIGGRHISLPCGALEGLAGIARELGC